MTLPAQFAILTKETPKPLFGLSYQSITEIIESFTQPSYRAKQLWQALYRQRVTQLDEIATLPAELRREMTAAGYRVGLPEIAQVFTSTDGTERYLIACADGESVETVETVWMPNGDGGERGDGSESGSEELEEEEAVEETLSDNYKRATICVSSQVGCAVNCQFCLTAKLGVKRNLTAGEIAGQVVAVLHRHQVRIGRDRINLVFMGMGEPFLNYDAFMDAVRLLVEGVGIPESRMTVSTSGILPGIERFATELVRPKLALSLNAPNDAIRESIMPITRKWNIDALLTALRAVPMRPRERMTFEYVLLGGVNDRLQDARELAQRVRNSNLNAKVNLIVWNPGPDVPYQMPLDADVTAFQQQLIAAGVSAYIRRPRGRDIYAACGQLKRTTS
ncbi:MAG TPA: 23S rRNA (adenine(2503)-C(2))-methyltransferase RlmN [Acidobacteriaceae bacterium]|jgi:23S rRNA (adenine2503-C2)-methyltransferase|nr:23S rRNA (adenine(2503)-C(2))-methyltransferase RlmN [Acidobacteriaceae bacterium]